MKEQQQKEKNPVYQVVRPYIYEGVVACVLDYVLFQFPSLLMLIFYSNNPKFMQICVLACLGLSTVIAAVFDAPLLIKSLRDKKNQTICGDWCIYLCKRGQISVQSVYPLWDAQHLRDIVLSKGMEYGAISLFASDA